MFLYIQSKINQNTTSLISTLFLFFHVTTHAKNGPFPIQFGIPECKIVKEVPGKIAISLILSRATNTIHL